MKLHLSALVILILLSIPGKILSQIDSASFFFVSGTALEPDGRAVSDAMLILLFGEKGSMKVSEEGYMLNPSINTDENGSFVLEVNKSVLLEYDYKFMLNFGSQRVSNKGVPVLFEIHPDTPKLDLGQIVIR